jgi:hypothetical protein
MLSSRDSLEGMLVEASFDHAQIRRTDGCREEFKVGLGSLYSVVEAGGRGGYREEVCLEIIILVNKNYVSYIIACCMNAKTDKQPQPTCFVDQAAWTPHP